MPPAAAVAETGNCWEHWKAAAAAGTGNRLMEHYRAFETAHCWVYLPPVDTVHCLAAHLFVETASYWGHWWAGAAADTERRHRQPLPPQKTAETARCC